MRRILSDYFLFFADSPELMLLLKSTLVVALGLLIVWANRSARASVRHLLLTCTFAVLLALPVATQLVPSFRFEMKDANPPPGVQQLHPRPEPLSETRSARPNLVSSASSRTPSIADSVKTIAWLVWGLGALLWLARLAASLLRLRDVRRRGIPALEIDRQLQELARDSGVRRPIEVLLHDDVDVPFTYGILRPLILLPRDARDWSEMDLRRVFIHELEHIKRCDWSIQIMARAVCSLYWFQPLVWVAWRQICLEAERACDDTVVVDSERTDYAEQLVGLARRLSNTFATSMLSMASRSDLSRRVSSILDHTQSRGRAGLRWTVLTLALSVGLLSAIAPGFAITRTYTQNAQAGTRKSSARTRSGALERALLGAVESGELAEIVEVLNAGANVNAVIEGDGTALIIASRDGNQPAVELLLARGADVNLAAAGDGNPLIMAAREGHEDIVKLLLERGADVNQIVEGDENALIQASGSGKLTVVKLLVSRGADVNARAWSGGANGKWRTPLLMARRGGHTDVVNFLISMGARE